ncbi:uncharacterized protein A4U43_C06F7260 [Asparagus officinalis]|uniref:Uncharacterized protein n=1 Tax=Asparagus officinalis TaxID=4686 RepID=A0A5P1EK87_ASPOF|nr:uncharacterized protein A4U43_C06F7260 [Asparagus officinalis]
MEVGREICQERRMVHERCTWHIGCRPHGSGGRQWYAARLLLLQDLHTSASVNPGTATAATSPLREERWVLAETSGTNGQGGGRRYGVGATVDDQRSVADGARRSGPARKNGGRPSALICRHVGVVVFDDFDREGRAESIGRLGIVVERARAHGAAAGSGAAVVLPPTSLLQDCIHSSVTRTGHSDESVGEEKVGEVDVTGRTDQVAGPGTWGVGGGVEKVEDGVAEGSSAEEVSGAGAGEEGVDVGEEGGDGGGGRAGTERRRRRGWRGR